MVKMSPFMISPSICWLQGELEIIISKVSSEEKWTHLTMLKKLAYKAQFLDQQSIRDNYAGF